MHQYGIMQFGKFEELRLKGFLAAEKQLKAWSEEGNIPSAYIGNKAGGSDGKTKGRSARRYSI